MREQRAPPLGGFLGLCDASRTGRWEASSSHQASEVPDVLRERGSSSGETRRRVCRVREETVREEGEEGCEAETVRKSEARLGEARRLSAALRRAVDARRWDETARLLLAAARDLRVDADALQRTNLGRAVNRLSRDEKVPGAVRAHAATAVEAWKRAIVADAAVSGRRTDSRRPPPPAPSEQPIATRDDDQYS